MLDIFRKFDKAFVKLSNVFLVFTIVMMVFWVNFQIATRFIFHISAPYAEEFSRLAIVWCILIGGAMAVRGNEHIRVDSLVNIFPKPIQFFFEILAYLLIIMFGYVIARYGAVFISNNVDFTTSLRYSRNIFYLPVVVSGIIMVVYSVANIVLLFYNKKNNTNTVLIKEE